MSAWANIAPADGSRCGRCRQKWRHLDQWRMDPGLGRVHLSCPPADGFAAILDTVADIDRISRDMVATEIRLCVRLTEDLGVPVLGVDVMDRRIEIRCALAPAEDRAPQVLASIEREFPDWTVTVAFPVPA